MPSRRKTDRTVPPPPPDDAVESTEPTAGADSGDEPEAPADGEIEIDPLVEDEAVVEETIDEEELDAEVKPPPRPAAKPSPGRPPGAKEEPEPPFNIGERIVLLRNTRPRTGTPIGDHPVGATGRVETVLSQTAIVRFDRAPDIKEVVAFVCLDSLDEEAKAARAARERELAAERAREEQSQQG